MASIRTSLALALLAGLATMAVPAAAHAAGCPDQPVERTFLPWLDPAWYAPAPDGGLEAGAEGWTLGGGAAVVDGNEPFHVGGPDDANSLALPPGASATTPEVCIGVEHPTIRFFARNTGSSLSLLRVSVVFRGLLGRQVLPVAVIAAGDEWAPSPIVPVIVNVLSLLGDQQVAFRFAPLGGEWTIDDVYVDPYKKG
jgi:hypothetical protein